MSAMKAAPTVPNAANHAAAWSFACRINQTLKTRAARRKGGVCTKPGDHACGVENPPTTESSQCFAFQRWNQFGGRSDIGLLLNGIVHSRNRTTDPTPEKEVGNA